jgi:hypothetical protein
MVTAWQQLKYHIVPSMEELKKLFGIINPICQPSSENMPYL